MHGDFWLNEWLHDHNTIPSPPNHACKIAVCANLQLQKFHVLLECKNCTLCARAAARLSHLLKARQKIKFFDIYNPSLTLFLNLLFSQVVVIWTSFSSASILSCVSSSQSFLFFLKFKKVIHFFFWAFLQLLLSLFWQLLHRSARVICERDTKSHVRHIPFSAPAHAQRLTKDSHNTGNFMPFILITKPIMCCTAAASRCNLFCEALRWATYTNKSTY